MDLLEKIDSGALVDEALNFYFSSSKIDESRKPIIYEIVAGVVRWKLYLEWLLSHHIRKKVKKKIENLLKLTLYQVEFMKKPAYHVVHEAVSFAKSRWGEEIGGFVNAVLRNHMRFRKNYSPPDLSVKYSFPTWLVKRWQKRFGDEVEHLLSHLNSPSLFGVRVNPKKISSDEVIKYFENVGIQVQKGRYLEYALYVNKLTPVLKSDLFKLQLIYIQDEASQLVSEALEVKEGGKVLDACCGYGTKTSHILDMYAEKCKVIALDKSGRKVKKVSPQALRVIGDIFSIPFKKDSFDTILLDAPCSSLGIIQKHPEIKWRISESDIERFSEIQVSLLKKLWETLKPGGTLIYSVCSFEPEETERVITELINTEEVLVEKVFPFVEGSFFISIPHRTGMDGFFIAKMKKARK
ncbi:MAG: 16S rRNA (cytosine(967)-C(5))-methyltransferase RsmB [Deltaproteobacteria bacterium]|nr:16S rRNA (cytosine(967)-C(5))-methyltransferase RsmB [Deltaproteobacteria bacterium]